MYHRLCADLSISNIITQIVEDSTNSYSAYLCFRLMQEEEKEEGKTKKMSMHTAFGEIPGHFLVSYLEVFKMCEMQPVVLS